MTRRPLRRQQAVRLIAANKSIAGNPRPYRPGVPYDKIIATQSCWCGNDVHGWPGDEERAPHPRDWPGKREGQPYPVPEGFEKSRNARKQGDR